MIIEVIKLAEENITVRADSNKTENVMQITLESDTGHQNLKIKGIKSPTSAETKAELKSKALAFVNTGITNQYFLVNNASVATYCSKIYVYQKETTTFDIN